MEKNVKITKPFAFFLLRIAFFYLNHRILPLCSSYSFSDPLQNGF